MVICTVLTMNCNKMYTHVVGFNYIHSMLCNLRTPESDGRHWRVCFYLLPRWWLIQIMPEARNVPLGCKTNLTQIGHSSHRDMWLIKICQITVPLVHCGNPWWIWGQEEPYYITLTSVGKERFINWCAPYCPVTIPGFYFQSEFRNTVCFPFYKY